MALNPKKALALALSAAMVVTAAPSATINADAAAKQGTTATKVTPSKTSVTLTAGKNSSAITVKLNAKTTKKVTINVKSSKTSVAKVTKSTVTIKKGAKKNTKSSSFKIKGVKKGSAKVTVSFKNSKGKTIKKVIKVTVKAAKVAMTGVSLSNTTPKVGDTITAKVEPSNATNVASYQWYTGDTASLTTAISGATSKDFVVTADQLGKFVGVVVTDKSGKSFTAVSSVAVQEADSTQIALTKAEQTGAKTVKLTFSGNVTASDKITVKKGSNEVKLDGAVDFAADGASGVITLADKITASEYEVTLTPADTKVAATSAKFTGEISELKEIKFLNNYLVMKDEKYNEGYAYAKGFDQFGGEVTLSGLSVTSGIGTFKSYDSKTGKITITATGDHPFMLIKEVPVFLQYQQGNNMIVANATLTVSTRSYVSEVEFGEIGKDGTMRDDKKITITELRSNKYYIELKSVKDQYGNELSDEDLNKQDEDNVLFKIPDTTGAFYSTGKFGKINGKTVLWLEGDRNSKPGTMALTITGASGKSFTKDITIEDDPYIQTMKISYPELYEGADESVALEFTAVDQYGSEFNLWDAKPYVTAKGAGQAASSTLIFDDMNHMTNSPTKITASGNAVFNIVTYDTDKKTFKVTIDSSRCDAKSIVVMTLTTAGMQVSTASITVGEVGSAAKVKTSLAGGNRQLAPTGWGADDSLNFNEQVRFEDANGNTMSRGDSKYPKFENGTTIGGKKIVEPTSDDKNNQYTSFAWTLTPAKVSAVSAAAAAAFDADGAITHTELTSGGATKADYYVTVYGKKGTNTDYYILDDQDFHLTALTGADKSYSATCDAKVYASTKSKDNDNEVKVFAETNQGEKYQIAAGRVSLNAGDFSATGAKIDGKLASDWDDNTSKEQTVSVSVDNNPETSVKVSYSNVKPVATTAKLKFAIPTTGSAVVTKVGKTFDGDLDGDSFESAGASTISVANGVLKITGANSVNDTFTAFIEDQYGVTMTDTTFTIGGKNVAKEAVTVANNDRVAIQYKNGSVSKQFYWKNVTGAPIVVSVTNTATKAVSTQAQFTAALANPSVTSVELAPSATAYDIPTTLGKDVTVGTGVQATISANVNGTGTIILEGEGQLNVTDSDENAGEDISVKNIKIQNNTNLSPAIINVGNDNAVIENLTVEANGHAVGVGTGKIQNATAGTWNINGSSLDISDGLTLDIVAHSTVSNLNIGTNSGTITVNDAAGLKTVLGEETMNGKVEIASAITADGSETYNVTSAKPVVLDLKNVSDLAGTIVNNGNLKLQSTGNTRTVAKVVNNGTFETATVLTITELQQNKTAKIGNGTDKTTVGTLVSKTGANTELTKASQVESTTGSNGGNITINEGAITGTGSGTTAAQTGTATVGDSIGTVATNASNAAVITTGKGVSTVATLEDASRTNKALSSKVSEDLGAFLGRSVSASITDGEKITSCKWVGFKNVKVGENGDYTIVALYNGKYYKAGEISNNTNSNVGWYEACDAGSVLMTAANSGSAGDLSKLTKVYLIEGTVDSAYNTGSDTEPTGDDVKASVAF